MLQQIRLQNFKIHTDTTIDLKPFTLLVGANGVGKTSVLEAIYFLQQYASGKPFERKWQTFFIKSHMKKTTIEGSWISKDSSHTFFEKISFIPDSPTDLDPRVEDNKKPFETISHDDFFAKNNYFSKLNITQLKLSKSVLSKPTFFKEIKPKISEDGHGLPSVIAYLMMYDVESFSSLISLFKQVVPSIKRIRVRPGRLEDIIGHELIFDTVSGTEIPASAMSEGTLIILGILTAIMHPDCPNTVLLDDIEQGLHPTAQRDLMNTLKRLQEHRPDLQIIATTHSPYIVDELPLDAVCVMACDPSGRVYAQTLDKHPDAERSLDLLTSGEFLSAEGESWVLPNA